MCITRNISNYDPKTRRIWAIGNFCLIAGIAPTLFADSSRHLNPNLFDALRGFCTGMAIVFLFWSSRRIRNLNSRP